jgi:hypothetical protein
VWHCVLALHGAYCVVRIVPEPSLNLPGAATGFGSQPQIPRCKNSRVEYVKNRLYDAHHLVAVRSNVLVRWISDVPKWGGLILAALRAPVRAFAADLTNRGSAGGTAGRRAAGGAPAQRGVQCPFLKNRTFDIHWTRSSRNCEA